ncbi:MAG: type IV pilin protein [Steroidobacteraceae bacterium]
MATAAERGVTLMELLTALAIVGILSALAYPGFRGQLLRAHRTEAITSLLALAAAQERHFMAHRAYATGLEGSQGGLPISSHTASGRYGLSVSGEAGGGYLASATVLPNGPQAADRECATLTLDANGTRRAYSASGEDSTRACWGR